MQKDPTLSKNALGRYCYVDTYDKDARFHYKLVKSMKTAENPVIAQLLKLSGVGAQLLEDLKRAKGTREPRAKIEL